MPNQPNWNPKEWDPATWFTLAAVLLAVVALLVNPGEFRGWLREAQFHIEDIPIPRWPILLLAIIVAYLGISIRGWLGKPQFHIRDTPIPRWAVFLPAFAVAPLWILVRGWLGRALPQVLSAIVQLRHFFSQTVLVPRWIVFSLWIFSAILLIALAVSLLRLLVLLIRRLLGPAASNHNT